MTRRVGSYSHVELAVICRQHNQPRREESDRGEEENHSKNDGIVFEEIIHEHKQHFYPESSEFKAVL